VKYLSTSARAFSSHSFNIDKRYNSDYM